MIKLHRDIDADNEQIELGAYEPITSDLQTDEGDPEPEFGIINIMESGHSWIRFTSDDELERFRRDPKNSYYMDRLAFVDFTTNTLFFALRGTEEYEAGARFSH